MNELRTMYMVNNYDLKIRVKDVTRYLRVRESDAMLRRLLDESNKCVYDAAVPKAVYTKVDVKIKGSTVDFGFTNKFWPVDKFTNLSTSLFRIHE